MNDEIKEIIKKLKDDGWYEELDLTGEMWIELRWKETHLLLDYITNLQQENERLKETNVYCNRTDCVGRIKDSKKYDSVYQEKEDYKSRIEKAVEYIKHKWFVEGQQRNNYKFDNDVIDILNGRSDE